jgi:hypothetical protein
MLEIETLVLDHRVQNDSAPSALPALRPSHSVLGRGAGSIGEPERAPEDRR